MKNFSPMRWMGRVAGRVWWLVQWWRQEFLDLFPVRIQEWMVGRGRGLLAVAPGPDAVIFELMTARRQHIAFASVRNAEYGRDSIGQFLRSHGFDLDDVDIGLRLPPERFFTRKLVLPAEVGEAIGEFVAKDLIRKTPFQLQDVYHHYLAVQTAGADKIAVWQWVIRREFVVQAATTVALDGAQVSFADASAASDPDTLTPFIWLRPDLRADRAWTAKLALTLGCVAFLLMLGMTGHRYWRQQLALDELDAAITKTRAKVQQVRAAMDDVERKQSNLLRLRARKRDVPTVLDIWEETTRLLPDHSWLSELRLSEAVDRHEYQVTLIGFSRAATNLISVLDRSPLFNSATLTAPVALDPNEARERFALQANVSARRGLKGAAR